MATSAELYHWIEGTYGGAIDTRVMLLMHLLLVDNQTFGDLRDSLADGDEAAITEWVKHADACINAGHDPLAAWQSDQEEPPEDGYLDVEEVPTEFTEPYEDIVGVVPDSYEPPRRPDYRTTKRPDAHEESGALRIPCKTCGAGIKEYCTFRRETVENQYGKRVRVVSAGKRGMPCVSRLLEASRT